MSIHGKKDGKHIYKFKERWEVSMKLYVRADSKEEAEKLREEVDNSNLEEDDIHGDSPEWVDDEIVIVKKFGKAFDPDEEIPAE